jgi:hypothetical protein
LRRTQGAREHLDCLIFAVAPVAHQPATSEGFGPSLPGGNSQPLTLSISSTRQPEYGL